MSIKTLDYEDCIERKSMMDGSTEIHCKLGLWSVVGCDRHYVEREARRYWLQYTVDNEYAAFARPVRKHSRKALSSNIER